MAQALNETELPPFSPAGEVARHPAMVSAETEFMIENMTGPRDTVTVMETSDTMADRGRVTHTTDEKVRMWKPTPAGYRPRWVPTGLIALNLRNGWKTSCPDCGRDCGDDPNDCTAHPPAAVAYCPKAGCAHKINLRNLALNFQNIANKDPNAIDLGYGKADELTMLKAAMDAHVITRHPREARILLGLRDDQERRLIPNNF